MATYVILSSFTAQGIEKVKDSPDRLAAFSVRERPCSPSRIRETRR